MSIYNHIPRASRDMIVFYLQIIITKAIIKVNAIIVKAIFKYKDRYNICNKIFSNIRTTSLFFECEMATTPLAFPYFRKSIIQMENNVN